MLYAERDLRYQYCGVLQPRYTPFTSILTTPTIGYNSFALCNLCKLLALLELENRNMIAEPRR
jgi:hypothetical protein